MNQATSQLFSASVFPRPLHAAALALAGWFLIIPPPRLVRTMEGFQTHFDAPQSKWVRMQRFNHLTSTKRLWSSTGSIHPKITSICLVAKTRPAPL